MAVEAAPIAVEAAQIAVGAAPVAVEAAPIAAEAAPIAVEAAPIAVEAAPITDEAAPTAAEAAPIAVEAAPVAVDAAPMAVEAAPIAAEAAAAAARAGIPGRQQLRQYAQVRVTGPSPGVDSNQIASYKLQGTCYKTANCKTRRATRLQDCKLQDQKGCKATCCKDMLHSLVAPKGAGGYGIGGDVGNRQNHINIWNLLKHRLKKAFP